MKTKDLSNINIIRVGNTVIFRGEPTDVDSAILLKTHKPIRLDHDIIAEVGFEGGCLWYKNDLYQLLLTPGKISTFQLYKNGRGGTIIKYVHELENAFLALAGREIRGAWKEHEKNYTYH